LAFSEQAGQKQNERYTLSLTQNEEQVNGFYLTKLIGKIF
jgi:hypothetical protein